MKLTIIAATGGVGRELLQQGLAAGHDVTAVVRNPGKLSHQVRAVTADLTAPNQAALESAVAGADAVLSGLGPHSNSDAGIAATGTRAIVAAMTATGVRRIVAVSAAPVSTVPTPSRPHPPKHDPGDGLAGEFPAQVVGRGGGGPEPLAAGVRVVPAEHAVELAQVDGQDGAVHRMPPGGGTGPTSR